MNRARAATPVSRVNTVVRHRFLSAIFTVAVAGACASTSTPAYVENECPMYTDLGAVRVNPAGSRERHLHVEVAFKVCPPDAGLAEIKRKRIELKHALISLLSGQSEAELEDPLRAEKLRAQIREVVNREVLVKGQAVDVFLTRMELQ